MSDYGEPVVRDWIRLEDDFAVNGERGESDGRVIGPVYNAEKRSEVIHVSRGAHDDEPEIWTSSGVNELESVRQGRRDRELTDPATICHCQVSGNSPLVGFVNDDDGISL